MWILEQNAWFFSMSLHCFSAHIQNGTWIISFNFQFVSCHSNCGCLDYMNFDWLLHCWLLSFCECCLLWFPLSHLIPIVKRTFKPFINFGLKLAHLAKWLLALNFWLRTSLLISHIDALCLLTVPRLKSFFQRFILSIPAKIFLVLLFISIFSTLLYFYTLNYSILYSIF